MQLSSWIIWAFAAIYGLTVLGLAGIIVSENRNPLKSLAWVTVLLTFPVGGLILYIFFGRSIKNTRMISRRKKRALRRIELTQESAGATQEGQSELLPPLLSIANVQTAMMAERLCSSRFVAGSHVEVFTSGAEKFKRLMADIASARKCIALQYYIFEDDVIGTELAELLIERARAGIAVRVIYDDIGSMGVSRKFFRRLAEAGVEIHPFFRVAFPPFATRINWRNHRKIVTIDGEIGYIGGMNIADRYIDGGQRFHAWRDTHLRVTGPAVAALRRSFATDWSFMGQPLDLEPLSGQNVAPAPGAIPAAMQLVTSGPTDQWSNIELILLKAIGGARKRVWIQTPYFLPPEGMLRALQTAALARIDVRVMMPRRSDSSILTFASRSYIKECLRAGIKFYFYTAGMLHAKTVAVDDDFASVGSANIDFRSFEHNFECTLLLYGQEANARLRETFSTDMRLCERIRLKSWRTRPLGHKAAESIMRLLSPVL
ncbi:MAG: cardiolipin synthase [Pseudoflavonifractor sp.]|nr:cardiolipin synthase [Alloprevotella sp.]MCM1117553.1 cardiolipin synthase [Pseudoflavonifractor sp.]